MFYTGKTPDAFIRIDYILSFKGKINRSVFTCLFTLPATDAIALSPF